MTLYVGWNLSNEGLDIDMRDIGQQVRRALASYAKCAGSADQLLRFLAHRFYERQSERP